MIEIYRLPVPKIPEPTRDNWVNIFQLVDDLRSKDDGGCILVARVLAQVFYKRKVSKGRMAIAAVRSADNRVEHAWLVVDGYSIHAPYKISTTELAELEERAEIDEILTAQLFRELDRI